MEQGKIIQIIRYHTNGLDQRTVVDTWEISANCTLNFINFITTNIITAAFSDGSDDSFEVVTNIDNVSVNTRKLCRNSSPVAPKSRLCVVMDDGSLEDFRSYCLDFFTVGYLVMIGCES